MPHVAAGAPPVLDRHGVAERCALEPDDFFTTVPTGADAIMLQQVLHDWDDSSARRLLRNCRAAMAESASLLIVERVMPDRAAPGVSTEPFLLDLEMLVGPGGQERTETEYRTLLSVAGFTLVGVTQTNSPVSIIEARPE